MDRNEEYPQFEFKPFPQRKMLDYYCPKRLADYNARQQAAHPPVQASIQDPVVITVDKDIAMISVGNNISISKTEDFSRAQDVIACGEVDFVSARILLLQLSQAAGV